MNRKRLQADVQSRHIDKKLVIALSHQTKINSAGRLCAAPRLGGAVQSRVSSFIIISYLYFSLVAMLHISNKLLRSLYCFFDRLHRDSFCSSLSVIFYYSTSESRRAQLFSRLSRLQVDQKLRLPNCHNLRFYINNSESVLYYRSLSRHYGRPLQVSTF